MRTIQRDNPPFEVIDKIREAVILKSRLTHLRWVPCECTGNLKLKATDSDHKSRRKSQQVTSLRCAKNSPIQSGGNSPKSKLSSSSKNQQLIQTERKSGGIEENTGSRSIKLQKANKETVFFQMEFKSFWEILAKEKAACAAESDFCTIWRSLCDHARTTFILWWF